MGCACYDSNGLPPIWIRCALVLKSVAAMAAAAGQVTNYSSSLGSPDTSFDVVFQQRSTANYLTCAMTQIAVQSVLWPATRFTGSYASPKFVCCALSKGVVDATIWVSPLCTSRAGKICFAQ